MLTNLQNAQQAMLTDVAAENAALEATQSAAEAADSAIDAQTSETNAAASEAAVPYQ